jgi:hypothetical protein
VAQPSEAAEKLIKAADENGSTPISHWSSIRVYPCSSAAIRFGRVFHQAPQAAASRIVSMLVMKF